MVQARAGVWDSKFDPESVALFADVVSACQANLESAPADSPDRKIEVPRLAKEALGYFDKAMPKVSDPIAQAQMLARKGSMQGILGDYAGADASLRKALTMAGGAGTLAPMLWLLKKRGAQAQIPTWCSYVRNHLHPKADLAKLCQLCQLYGAQVCNSAFDRDMMADKTRLRVEAADAEQRRGTSSDPNVLLDAVASMPIVNECPNPVRLFFGMDPAGPGLMSTINGKASFTKRLQLHNRVWILDAQGRAVSHIIVKNEYPQITINASGNGFE